jgi:hypothetical protein
MDFTRLSKTHILLKIQLLTEVPGNIWGLTNIPLLCGLALRKIAILAMRSLAMASGAGGRNPANSGGGVGRTWAGNGLQVPRARFPGWEGSGPRPAARLGGGGVGRPLEHALR